MNRRSIPAVRGKVERLVLNRQIVVVRVQSPVLVNEDVQVSPARNRDVLFYIPFGMVISPPNERLKVEFSKLRFLKVLHEILHTQKNVCRAVRDESLRQGNGSPGLSRPLAITSCVLLVWE